MLETIAARQAVYYFIGAALALGIAAKLTAGIALKRLVKAASNMSRSSHALMRLVRAKFEHACMVSDKVHNIGAFVDKYLYEYRVLGFRLHTLRRLEMAAVLLCLLCTAAGASLSFLEYGAGQEMYQCLGLGGAGTLFLLLLRGLTDERYQLQAARMYMVDFLENTYARRYEKPRQNEYQVTVQRAAEPEPQYAPQPEPQRQGDTVGDEPSGYPEREPVREPQSPPLPRTEPLWQAEGAQMDLHMEEEYELEETPIRLWEPPRGERTDWPERPRSTAPMPRAEPMDADRKSRTASSSYVQGVRDGGQPPDGTPEPGDIGGKTAEKGQLEEAVKNAAAAQREFVGQEPAAALEQTEETRGSAALPREARIREILEEFLA